MKEKIVDILISICLFIVGMCLLLWAEKVTNTVSIILGCVMIVYGIYEAFNYYKSTDKNVIDVIFAIILIACGIILVVKPSIVTELISIVIGAYILLSSIVRLRIALEVKKLTNYNLGFGLSICGIVIGILCIVGKLLIPNIALQFVGVMLMVYSITNIINVIALPAKSKNKK